MNVCSVGTLIALLMVVADGEALVTRSLPTFRRQRIPRGSSLTMDMEGGENQRFLRPVIKENLSIPFPPLLTDEATNHICKLEQVEASLGMPWRESIEERTPSTNDENTLLYMPFWEWQMQFLKENLTNLRVVSCTDHSGTKDFSFRENSEKGARIVNICLTSDEYRKIRMTYYDSGSKTQVFNSLWYPDASYNLPVLGIDLLQFNQKKHLAVVDFQPIQEEEHHHAMPYEHLLQPIRARFPSLQGKMSARFYDEAQFFSNQMLFARFDDAQTVDRDLLPAFQDYVQTHVNLVKATPPTENASDKILRRQAAYDSYSAERDPATAMFARMFGKEWADSFVYEFLFSLSKRPC